MLWQVGTKDAVIFPNRLDWICTRRNSSGGTAEGDETDQDGDCIWSECILWFFIFALVQTGCFIFILYAHLMKPKFCCKKSKAIELDDSQLLESGSAL